MMVKTTFKRVLKGTKYDINRSIVEAILNNMGYTIRESPYGLEALKYDGLGRFHFIIEVSSDGNIHKSSEIVFHKDRGVTPGHKIDERSDKVQKEFARFQNDLMVELKKQKNAQEIKHKRKKKESSPANSRDK